MEGDILEWSFAAPLLVQWCSTLQPHRLDEWCGVDPAHKGLSSMRVIQCAMGSHTHHFRAGSSAQGWFAGVIRHTGPGPLASSSCVLWPNTVCCPTQCTGSSHGVTLRASPIACECNLECRTGSSSLQGSTQIWVLGSWGAAIHAATAPTPSNFGPVAYWVTHMDDKAWRSGSDPQARGSAPLPYCKVCYSSPIAELTVEIPPLPPSSFILVMSC